MAASVLGVFCYNFFLLPPAYSIDLFTIADPHNWIALAAFIITASTVGHLSVMRKRREAEIGLLARRRSAVAEIEQYALAGDPAVSLLDEATALVARTLEIECCQVLELLPDGQALLLRSGVGWKEGEVGRATVPAGTDSQAGFALLTDEPVVVEDLRAEARFTAAPLLRDHDIVSGMSVVISTSEGPYGILGAHSKQRRRFTKNELGFLRAIANVLGAAIERQRAEKALRASEANLNRAQEVAHLGSWYLNVSDNRLIWSDEVFRIFGMPKTPVLTYDTFLALVHPDDRERVDRAWQAAVRGAPYDVEHRICVNGALKWVREQAKVAFDSAGNAVEGVGTVQDVTERKRAEEEIRTLNAELEQRVADRTAELQAANQLKDELLQREQATARELTAAREREIEIGYRIQKTLLLDQPPQDIPGLRVAALTIPSQRIDGDFYLFFKHPDRRLDVIVGDVMGKGVPAALLGAATKSHFIKALARLTALSRNSNLPQPEEIVTLAHADVVRHLIDLESFVTLCYARLDLNEHRLDFVDCGHTGIIHLHRDSGRCDILRGDNLPLGVRAGEIYSQTSAPFTAGDVLLFYSDGVTEARNAAGEVFGTDRLLNSVATNAGLAPEDLVEVIRAATVAFSASGQLTDDLTCVAIKVEDVQSALASAELALRSDFKELGRVREFVRSFCRDCPAAPLNEDGIDALVLAVNEAASNIMKHAYHGRSDQWIDVKAEVFPGQVSISLYHLGDPFDPAAVAPPALDGSQESGFGVYLITQSVDDVRYYRDERGRNCVALAKSARVTTERETRWK